MARPSHQGAASAGGRRAWTALILLSLYAFLGVANATDGVDVYTDRQEIFNVNAGKCLTRDIGQCYTISFASFEAEGNIGTSGTDKFTVRLYKSGSSLGPYEAQAGVIRDIDDTESKPPLAATTIEYCCLNPSFLCLLHVKYNSNRMCQGEPTPSPTATPAPTTPAPTPEPTTAEPVYQIIQQYDTAGCSSTSESPASIYFLLSTGCVEQGCDRRFDGMWSAVRCSPSLYEPADASYTKVTFYDNGGCTGQVHTALYVKPGVCVWRGNNSYATYTCGVDGYVIQKLCIDSACLICTETSPVASKKCHNQQNYIAECALSSADNDLVDGSSPAMPVTGIVVIVVIALVVLVQVVVLVGLVRRGRRSYTSLSEESHSRAAQAAEQGTYGSTYPAAANAPADGSSYQDAAPNAPAVGGGQWY